MSSRDPFIQSGMSVIDSGTEESEEFVLKDDSSENIFFNFISIMY